MRTKTKKTKQITQIVVSMLLVLTMIRLKWIDHQSDRIHSSHIWLKNSQNGRKYSFLTEYIAPENGREEDCYIIEILPGRANPNTLVIEGDEILLEKYAIVR